MTSNPCAGDGLGQPAALPGFSHIELSYVTTFYFNQTDSSSLLELLRRYASYPGDLLDRLQFLLVDDGVAPACSEEHCEEGCAECALALAEATTLVKFVDEKGKVQPTDARELLGVENFQTVVVRGIAARDKAGNLSVVADGIYIRR